MHDLSKAKTRNTSPTLPLGSTKSAGSTPKATASTETVFPSHAHLTHLRQRRQDHTLDGMLTDEVWQHHAYFYGFCRVYWNSTARTTAIDRDGKWFSSDLADTAEAWYRDFLGRRGRIATDLQKERQYAEADRARDEYARSLGYADWAECWNHPGGIREQGRRGAALRARGGVVGQVTPTVEDDSIPP